MVFITGDIHGNTNNIANFCDKHSLTSDDVIILLGDVGLNFWLKSKDKKNKYILNSLGPTFLCVHGNHEERPENISTYKVCTHQYGTSLVELAFNNILFCIDGEVYNIDGKSYLCLGGAYSVDKYYRLRNNIPWFKSEQMSEDKMNQIASNHFGKSYDYIISHTCPLRYMPVEKFLSQVDQSTVDHSMEEFLGECEANIMYDRWFCGHWHTDKTTDRVRFLFNDIISI